MKRRTKLILLVAVLGCLGGIGVVLSKIAQEAGVPFPGAVVVLDDASWRAREEQDVFNRGYLWANADTILYEHKAEDGYRVVRRRILPDKTVSAPESLPFVVEWGEHIASLSPDGTLICIWKHNSYSDFSYRLVRKEGKGKPVRFRSYTYPFYWSPDSQSLYGMVDSFLPPRIERYVAKTGAVTKMTLDTKDYFHLETVTPEGKLLDFDYEKNSQAGSTVALWKIDEVQGKKVDTTTYQKRFQFTEAYPYFSPDGKRILWALHDTENSLWEKIQNKLFRKNITPHQIYRYMVTDIDGKNERWVGSATPELQITGELYPEWTRDGKGVSFIHNSKLMYLAVP